MLFAIFLASCCDCFDGDEGQVIIHFNLDSLSSGFKASEIHSSYMIKTEKGNLNLGIDTILQDYPPYGFRLLRDDNFDKFDFIVKNDTPYFNHTITDIAIQGKTSSHCKCYKNEYIEIKFDSTLRKEESEIELIINK